MPQVVARRMKLADDGRHEHVALVGYSSGHLTSGEPITIDVERVLSKTATGERFFVTTTDGEAEIVSGKCPVCGYEPYLRTSADSDREERLLALPEAS